MPYSLLSYPLRGFKLARKFIKVKCPTLEAEHVTLVSHVDIAWNSFLPYLIKLNDQLENLGFRYVDNKVIVSKEGIDKKGYNKSFETDLDEFYKEFTMADSE